MRLGTAPITWGVCEMDGWGERLPTRGSWRRCARWASRAPSWARRAAGVFAALDLARSNRWVIVEQDVRLGVGATAQDPVANARASRAHLLGLAP